MLSTHRGVSMATHEALCLLLLVVTACEGASLVLEASSLRISPDGEANFTMNCTTDEAGGSGEHSQIQKEIVDVQRMRISKMRNNRWEPIVQMDSDWKSPVVHPGIIGDHDLASGILQAIWPMAINSTAGEYTCDLMAYGRSGQLISLRSPAIYVDVQLPMTLYDLFKMVKTSSKKFETDIERNKDMIKRANTKITQNKEAIETASADIDENKETIEAASAITSHNEEAIKLASANITENKEALEMASVGITENKEAFEMVSADITENKEAFEMVSADITENKEAIKNASADITENKEAIKLASAENTENKEAIEMASADIAQNEQAIKQTKTGQDTLYKMLNQTSNTVENNTATPAQVKQNQNVFFFEQWPEGRYFHIRPQSGCPRDTATAQWSLMGTYIQVEAAGVRISTGAHMKEPPITPDRDSYNRMEMSYCGVFDSPSVGGPWPPGSYCLEAAGLHACPTGFSAGTITYGRKDPCHWCSAKRRYCCRNDSLPDRAILLPTEHPFYLFRFGGKCQQVWGMSVREEYMVIDTVCCDSKYSGSVPDGKKTSSEITLQLCYYERDTNNG